MIDYIELIIGGKIIQRETGETLNMRVCLTNQEQESYSATQLYRMLGGGPGSPFTDLKQFPRPHTLIVPVEFYFNGHVKLALPLTALRFQEVEVNLGFREASRWGGVDSNVADAKVYLQVEYGYVEESILKGMIRKPLIYPVEQFQVQEAFPYQGDSVINFPDSDPSRSSGIPFSNPVKAVFGVMQSVDLEVTNIFDYTRGFSYEELTDLQGNDFLKTMEFNLDGGTLLPEQVGIVEMLRGYQYYAYFPGATQSLQAGEDRLYSYIYALSFCRDPMNREVINGSLNFSTIQNARFQIKGKGTGGNINATGIGKGLRNYGANLSSTAGISVGDYLVAKNVQNDAIVLSIEPTFTVFYNENGTNYIVVKERDRASNIVVGSTLTFSDASTVTVDIVPSGSGALGEIHRMVGGESYIALSSLDVVPISGDVVNTSAEKQITTVDEVKGGTTSFVGTSITSETSNIYLSATPTNVSLGMYVEGVSVTSGSFVDSIYTSLVAYTGVAIPTTVLGAVSIVGTNQVTVANPSYLYVGLEVAHPNFSIGSKITDITGNTVTFANNFNTFPDVPPDGSAITFYIFHIKVSQALTASPTSEAIGIYPTVTLTGGTVVGSPAGQVKFGDVIEATSAPSSSKTGDTVTLTNSLEMSLEAIKLARDVDFTFNARRSSKIRTRLYALSTNFLIIEGGAARLAYKGSEISLPRFT